MFENRGRIIRDGVPLDFSYVPESLVGRDGELGALESAFRPLFFSSVPCTVYVHGHVGSGKTVTVLRFCADMAKAFSDSGKALDTAIVNCRMRNSEYAVMLDLVRHFDKGFPDRGFSVDEIYSSFVRHVKDSGKPIIIILDEADVLLSGQGGDTIYRISRADSSQPISLILISQKSPELLPLDVASRSTFGRANTIRFERYSRPELRQIAVQRADLSLYPGVIDDGCLDLIADNAEPHGDARFAIEVLEKAASMAESEGADRILPEHVQKAGGSVHSDFSEEKISALNIDRKLVLLAISRGLLKRSEVTLAHAEGTYAAACEEWDVPVKKHTQFYTYAKDLEKAGLIRAEVRREPEGGRGTYISIANLPPKEIAEVLEGMLDSDRRRPDEVRPLQPRGDIVSEVQRGPPLLRAFHQPCAEGSQEGGPPRDLCDARGHHRRRGLGREGQHGHPVHPQRHIQLQERDRPRLHLDRRGHRRIPSPVPRHSQEVLRREGDRVPLQVVLGVERSVDGRHRARVREHGSVHVLRRVQAQADERRGEEGRC